MKFDGDRKMLVKGSRWDYKKKLFILGIETEKNERQAG